MSRRSRARRQIYVPTDVFSGLDKVDALLSSPAFYRIAATIPTRSPGSVGRPNRYPNLVYFAYCCLAGELGSHKKTVATLRHPMVWKLLRDRARRTNGERLPATPPTRDQFQYGRARIADRVDEVAEVFRAEAFTQAKQMNMLNPEVPFSTINPLRSQAISGDGKVLRSPVRQHTLKRWRDEGRKPRIPVDQHWEGGSNGWPSYGSKFFTLTARSDNRRNNRLVLDVRHVPHQSSGGEAEVAMEAVRELLDRPDGSTHVITYDGAFRGKHIDELMKRGLIALVPVRDSAVRSRWLRDLECPCGGIHELHASRGQIIELRRNRLTGKEFHVAPRVERIQRVRNKNGMFRWYAHLRFSCGNRHIERLDTSSEDIKDGFNRAEHLRQSVRNSGPKQISVYDRCYGWREDSESGNRVIEDNLANRQVIGYSIAKQLLLMVGMAIVRNSMAWALHRARNRP